MSVYLTGNKDAQPSAYSTDNNVPTVKYEAKDPTKDPPIISGFSLQHQTSDKNQKVEYPYSCNYQQVVAAGATAPPGKPDKASEGKPCPAAAGVPESVI